MVVLEQLDKAAEAIPQEPEERGSFQVIILVSQACSLPSGTHTDNHQGGGGGPSEDNVTGILVRAVKARWAKNSILAVDAGVHLSAIVDIFSQHMPKATRYRSSLSEDSQLSHSIFSPVYPTHAPARASNATPFSPIPKTSVWGPSSPTLQVDPTSKYVQTTGPFKNILLPCETAKANAQQLLRNLISTYLITHPHLDHFAGFAINTAAFHATSRPKKIAALPHTIDAIKTNIFNDVIWPNMSDEEGGIGFISYTRLIEGGNVALGEGEGRGYIEVCEGLEVKSRSVSHGHCMKKHPNRNNGQEIMAHHRRSSRGAEFSSSPDRRRGSLPQPEYESRYVNMPCVIDSTAFFIRAEATGEEILVFGDVEPDSISLSPRNARVWADAATKIVSGLLKAIFIECSYTDAQTDETLFGHLAPRHLIAELAVLAECVRSSQVDADPLQHLKPKLQTPSGESLKKRKREHSSVDGRVARGRGPRTDFRTSRSISPSTRVHETIDAAVLSDASSTRRLRPQIPNRDSSNREALLQAAIPKPQAPKPLEGLRVVIIHIKDNLLDSPDAAETIVRELRAHEHYHQLGVDFIIPERGGYMYL